MIGNPPLPQEVTRYLSKYATDSWSMEMGSRSGISMAVVIPALMEYDNIRTLLLSLSENDTAVFEHSVIVFVINNLKDVPREVRQDNLRSIELIRGIINGRPGGDALSERIISSGLRLGLVDASTSGNELPEKDGGVGLARKTGMDLSLSVFDYSDDGEKILVCLDADCTVDKNYMAEVYRAFRERKIKAASLNFRHKIAGREEKDLAIICYEIFLRYYVLGLKYASSPYAFHTIGSSMACTAGSYIKIEGMNKRKAAEDFYFLEKLAKTVQVQSIPSACVYPSGRGSWRVPFGTGQRVNRYLDHSHDEYLLYSPSSFTVLKSWLSLYGALENNPGNPLYDEAGRISPALRSFLEQQNFLSGFERILQNSKMPGQLKKQKDSWFDGFRTLKLIHFLRDNGFKPVRMFDALDELFSLLDIKTGILRQEEIPEFGVQMEYLDLLRKLDPAVLP